MTRRATDAARWCAVTRAFARVAAALALCGAPFSTARAQDSGTAPNTRESLPITLVPSTEQGIELALLITGDGGYVSADRRLAEELSKSGVSVVALNVRSYLSKKRTPEQVAADATQILSRWLATWKRSRVMLIGYSRGADIMPFIANRLPGEMRARLELIAILSPARRASFHFHWRDLLFDTVRSTDLPVLPELERLRGEQILCVYGDREKDPLCPSLDSGLAQVVERTGAHRIGAGEAPALARLILKQRKQ